MFKKLLIASAVVALSSNVAFAAHAYKGDYKGEAAPCPSCPVHTFGGPYVGVSLGNRTNYTGSPVTFKGIDGILSAGYGAMLNPAFYLAGEAFMLWTAKVKDMTNTSNTGSTLSAKSNWSYGLDIIPGYLITDNFLGYLRAGVVRTRFNGQSTNKTGWQAGVGGETNVYQNWDLRAEWIYSGYGSVSGVGKMNSEQVNVGLVYKFV